MLRDRPLPVRPAPAAGEAFTSYVDRLAGLNGLGRSAVLRRPVDRQVLRGDLERVAQLAGLSVRAVHELTLDIYPYEIAGQGRAEYSTWTLPAQPRWVCPLCTARTGIRKRDWRLALHPVCLDCGVLLTARPVSADTTPAPDALLRAVAELADLAHSARTKAAARTRLARHSWLCGLTARTIDGTWPARDESVELDLVAAHSWRSTPPTDPATVAVIILATQPALHCKTAERDLITRSCRRPNHLSTTDDPETHRLGWLLARLQRIIDRHRLQLRHLPALLPQPTDAGPWPEPAEWERRLHGSIAAHIMIGRLSGGPVTPISIGRALGFSQLKSSREYDNIRYHVGITDPLAALISDAVNQLVADGLVDYRRRRDTLRTVNRLPRLPVPVRRLPDIDTVPGRVLGLSWLWLRLTHGPPAGGAAVPARAVLQFDNAIDPETKLALYEAGLQILDETELDVTTVVAALPAPAEPHASTVINGHVLPTVSYNHAIGLPS